MGFVFAVLGAIAGGWLMSGRGGAFGVFAGMIIGWILQRLIAAQSTIRSLTNRVDNLEQRNAATAHADETVPAAAKVAAKKFDKPARVSIYEPEPTPEPELTPKPELKPEPERVAVPLPPVAADRALQKEADEVVQKRTPVQDVRPSMGAHSVDVAKRWLTTGNVPVKVGVIISFFGVAFLLKYAVEAQLFSIPISVRYLTVAAFAAALLVIGWRKRSENRTFALAVQGGGIGILYLTVFAAFRLHGLLPPVVAFGFLILVTAAAGALAIKQESRAFAILGTTGGFLAPLLVSTGSGNHVGLFSYYLILNSAVLGVAWYRAWRELNIIGFVFTFGVGTIWGYQYYTPELFSTTEPFLVLYFLFYTIIAVLFAFRRPPELRGYVDGTLLFGTPTIAFALQSQMLGDTEYGMAVSATVVSAFYAAMALWLRRTQEKNFTLMAQAFIALAVAFGTIAVPLALDDRWTAIAWALEGAALVWVGVRQSATLAKMSGAALAFAGGAEFVEYGWVNDLGIPILNGNFMGGALIAVSSLYSAWMLLFDERGREWQKFASGGLLIWGLGWWFSTGFGEISDRATFSNELLIAIAYFGASFAAMRYAANRLQWLLLWQITLGFLPFAGGAALIAYGWTDNLGIPVLNGNVLGGAMIAWMALYSARKLRTDERADEALKFVSVSLLFWGLMFWFGTGSAEIMDRAPASLQLHGLLLFGALSVAAIGFAGKHFDWIAYRRVSLALLPALFFGAIIYLFDHEHFFDGLGVLGWLVAIGAHISILRFYGSSADKAVSVTHAWGAMFFVGLLSYEVFWQIDQMVRNDVWSVAAGLLALAGGGFGLLTEKKNQRWPFTEYNDAYLISSLLLVVLYSILVVGVCINDPGDPSPLPYIPILNPFDVLSLVVLLLIGIGLRLERKHERLRFGGDQRVPQVFFGAIALLLSTISVVRAVHHVTGIAWTSSALMDSVTVQSALSIYWAILGLTGMVIGTRRAKRNIWMPGAGLMIVVVLKLFVIDLGGTGTVARIVSFLGVGVALLVVGYFSPVPPKSTDLTDR